MACLVYQDFPISILPPPIPSRWRIPRSGRTVAPCIPFFLCILVSLACRTCSCHEWLFTVYLSFLSVVLGDEFEYEDPVEYVHEEQGFDTSENIAGKMIITLEITSIFALLVVRSIAMLRYLSLAINMPPILPCSASNHPFLANRCLAQLPLLRSHSYSVASCR